MKKGEILLKSILVMLLFLTVGTWNKQTRVNAATSGSGARIIEYGVSGTARFHMANPVGTTERLTVEATGSKTITNINFTTSNSAICSITKKSGYWEVTRLREGIAVISMSCKANDATVTRDLLMSNLSYLPNNERPNGTVKAMTTVYYGCSAQAGITSDTSEIKEVLSVAKDVRITYECNDFYRVELLSGTFGDSGVNYGHVLKSQVDVPITNLTVKSTITMKEKERVALGAVVTPAVTTQSALTYRSSNMAVATVDATGTITATGVGSTQITVASVSKPALVRQCTVTVNPLYPVTGISINPKTLTIEDGTKGKFDVTFTPENASVKEYDVEISDDTVIQVDPAGRYLALYPGTATVTVVSKDGGFRDSCEVVVTPVKATGVYLQPSLNVSVGGQGKLVWNMLPMAASNKTVTWSSDNPAIAKVDRYGNVTGVKSGDTYIRVVTADGNFTAACVVEVDTYVQNIEFTNEVSEMTIGESKTIQTKLTPVNPGKENLIWNSKNPTVVSVTQSGVVKALKTGVAEVVAYDRYTGAFDFVVIDVNANLSKPKLKGQEKGKNLTLTWKKVDRATHYCIYKYNKKKKKYVKTETVASTKKSYKIKKVEKGQKYKIAAYYKPNDEYSKYSKVVKVKG